MVIEVEQDMLYIKMFGKVWRLADSRHKFSIVGADLKIQDGVQDGRHSKLDTAVNIS